jgi:hypothetical protein
MKGRGGLRAVLGFSIVLRMGIVRCFETDLDADVVMEGCFWYAFAADKRTGSVYEYAWP